MNGTPVWLASLSRASALVSNKPIATGLWSKQTIDDSAAMLRRLLGTAGNPQRERLFRMNITLCLHRALTPDEVGALPEYFHTDPATDLAGGPIEILWENEVGLPSTQPCHHPRRQDFGYGDPLPIALAELMASGGERR
jgi:hypothetical protein